MQWYAGDFDPRHKQATYQRDAELRRLKRTAQRSAGEGRSTSALTARLAAAVAALGERTTPRRPQHRPAAGR